ncbi:hypothetical protein BGW80DRAFT_369507 [Lactifluus volemus]|nr:hypothetical protein BGW80DRAFT_369507 [Lactifluus volemus]
MAHQGSDDSSCDSMTTTPTRRQIQTPGALLWDLPLMTVMMWWWYSPSRWKRRCLLGCVTRGIVLSYPQTEVMRCSRPTLLQLCGPLGPFLTVFPSIYCLLFDL